MFTFPDPIRDLLDTPGTFARLATTLPDGAPQNTVIWFRRDGDTLRMSCGRNAQKARNIRRDGRVSVVVERPADPYTFVEIRGVATVDEDAAGGLEELRALSHRYIGQERGDAWIASMPDADMVTLIIRPVRVNLFTDQEP
ncbi:MAG: PPOX class F420-dependent oxidoreductase [Chloroflexi bacterium]|nr:MAG: PPOX class F420-dependent oxidoreductase [Chloroflexota bacterium]